MSKTLSINPLTRIEGHLAIHANTEALTPDGQTGHRITAARCVGEMFRGFEQILVGRDPLDAQQITQRICGVCPVSHAIASVGAQEMAYGIRPPRNGRLMQNLILAANALQSHILHFYQLAALDFVDTTKILGYTGSDRTLKAVKSWVEDALARQDTFAGAPFLPRCEGDYVADADRSAQLLDNYIAALRIRSDCHAMGAVFGARLPHATAILPGGCTETPTMERVLAYGSRLKRVHDFIEHSLLPDLLAVAEEFPNYFDIGATYDNYLCFGVYPLDDAGRDRFIRPGTVIDGKWEALDPAAIEEEVSHSRYANRAALHPAVGEIIPEPRKPGAYSWIKAPRYHGQPMQVGPIARLMTGYLAPGSSWVKQNVDEFLAQIQVPVEKLNSVLGRHIARVLECRWLVQQIARWLDEIEIDAPATVDFEIPAAAAGVGLTEAPRGALGHWLTIEDHRIARYQCVVPSTWNCSPRDEAGQPGPIEKALEGAVLADPSQPLEAGRIVRSFDPCVACSIH